MGISCDVEIGGQQISDVDLDSESDAEYARRLGSLAGNPVACRIRFSMGIGVSGFPADRFGLTSSYWGFPLGIDG